MTQPRNVLFIIIDQLRADCLTGDLPGALAAHVDLPNLRAFMDDAVSFTRHYSAVNPCGPSRASILTGQYAMNHRSVRNGTPLRHDTPSIASEMRKAGYLPMLFGYTDTGQDPRKFHPNDPLLKSYEAPMPGFHEMTEMRLDMSYPWRSHLMNAGYRFDNYADVYKPVAPEGGLGALRDPALYAAKDSDTAFLTDRFLAQMPAYRDDPWFAHLTYIRPHPPLVAPAPYNTMYDPDALPLPARHPLPEDEVAQHPFFAPALATSGPKGMVEGRPDLAATDETAQALRALYLGLATEVDHHIGRVMQWLKDSGQLDNTMVVITADHGEMLGDHHVWGKMSVYDAAYRTPLIIRLPDGAAQAGRRVTAMTESIDITPTVLEWVGQDVPTAMDGRSLMPLLLGDEPDDWRNYTFSELDFANPLTDNTWQQMLGTNVTQSNLAILRDERFTLVQFAADLPPILFDYRGDGEMRNVAGDPSYAVDLARLTQQMLRHRMRNMDHTLSMTQITPDGARTGGRHPRA
ncbi:sulfatase-like hydrolase/transferase [Rhodobacteraceae bacterium KMM 6894]|nr:sulfatase-like hydrolase/transferase [Rhodobacteraceae bacterium KMM 6894]